MPYGIVRALDNCFCNAIIFKYVQLKFCIIPINVYLCLHNRLKPPQYYEISYRNSDI